MSQQEQNGTPAPAVFTTAEQARAAQPKDHPKWKIWKIVSPQGTERYVWGDGSNHVLRQVALVDGYQAANLDAKPANPALLSGMLASLSEGERMALLAPYLPAAPAAGKGKGK
jgi:hypothetical protein